MKSSAIQNCLEEIIKCLGFMTFYIEKPNRCIMICICGKTVLLQILYIKKTRKYHKKYPAFPKKATEKFNFLIIHQQKCVNQNNIIKNIKRR